jgi:SAM-dependent methyltransferase
MGSREEVHRFWDRDLRYHRMAREVNLELTEIRKAAISHISPGALALDVACGSGELGLPLSRRARYVGVDLSLAGLSLAKEYAGAGASFVRGSGEFLPFHSGAMDVVISTASLEHFFEPYRVLEEMVRTCRHGGKIILLSGAWENPFLFPPSIEERMRNRWHRCRYILHRLLKLLQSYGLGRLTKPDIVEDPELLSRGYEPDRDAVYIVSIREVVNYLGHLGCRILFLGTNQGITRKVPLLRYFGTSLFVVAEKPPLSREEE